MGYFAHRELLDEYLEKHCRRCVHAKGKAGEKIIQACAVLRMHMVLYGPDIGIPGFDKDDPNKPMPVSADGSDAGLNAAFANSLEILIPENWKFGFETSDDNLKCKMFVAVSKPKAKDSALESNTSKNK